MDFQPPFNYLGKAGFGLDIGVLDEAAGKMAPHHHMGRAQRRLRLPTADKPLAHAVAFAVGMQLHSLRGLGLGKRLHAGQFGKLHRNIAGAQAADDLR